MGDIHLNHSVSPYGGNNFHHLHPFPAKADSSSGRLHHPLPPHHAAHSLSSINLTQNLRYLNEATNDLSANNTDTNTPLSRHHRNVSSSLNSPNSAMITSPAAAVLLPAATTTLPTLLWSTNLVNRSGGGVNWSTLHTTIRALNQTALIDSTTPLHSSATGDIELEDTFVGSDMDVHSSWPSEQDVPILIGAVVGGSVLLIVLIILLLIWHCCDRHGHCNGGRDKNNFNNGSSDRSNRSSLSVGSCSSGSAGGNGAKRNSSSLYINNPNSLEVEAGCGSPEGMGSSTTANLHPQHGHFHFANYEYGPGPGGGGGAKLVIGNTRVLATALTTQADIPRSVSVPLSRSNSRKDSGSATPSQHGSQFVATSGGGYLEASEPQPTRSQLSQALTRNIATYYESQRQKNAKSKSSVSGSGHDKSAIILNDLSLNMDMVGPSYDGHPYSGNVIVSRPNGQWVMLEAEKATHLNDAAFDMNQGQSEFYRTRSLPWSQSSRNGGKFTGATTATTLGSTDHQQHSDHPATHSGTTTMGRVNFTKKRRNRMRNDSAAAIAFNRSGFLGGSLDWDFNGSGQAPEEANHSPTPVVMLPTMSQAPVTLPQLTSQLISANCKPDRESKAVGRSSSTAGPKSGGDSPDSGEYIPNDAIVVYNERTAL